MGTRSAGTGTVTLAGKLTLGHEAADPATGMKQTTRDADDSMAERVFE